MPLGKPSIATPRALELRVIAQAIENIRQRIEAIETQTTTTAAQAGETTLRAGQQNISITALRTQLVALVARVDALAATDTELETFRAGSAIAVNTAVYPSGDGFVSQVDPSDPLKVYAVLGVATQAAAAGANVVVRKAGVMQIASAGFEPGGPVYVGVAGLTQFPDYINLAIPVGVATSTDEIDVRPGWPALQYPGVYSDYETFLPPTWGLVRDAVTLAQDFNSAGNGLVVKIGPDNVTTRTIEAGGNLVVEDGDGVGDNPLIYDTPISDLPIRSGGLNGHEAVAVDAGDGTSYQVTVQDIADLGDGLGGTVTSVGITGADFTIAGSPVTSSGSINLTLATVNGNVGSFGSSTAVPNFTVNAKGLITAAGTSAVVAPAGTLTGTTLAANVVTSSLTSVGTIGTGVWQGTAVAPNFGGTGVANNVASTLTISGAFASTFTLTGTTSVTFPTSGTLATTTQLPTGANPTASVGLTVVNGVATTFMRSDGAPALDQGIAPTWTAAHRFNQAVGIGASNSNTTGSMLVVAGAQFNSLLVRSTGATGGVGSSDIYLGSATADNTGGVIGYDHTTDRLGLGASGAVKVTVDGATGDVGVGTTTPIAKLHVNSNPTPTNVTSVANTLLHLSGANSASNLLVLDSFAGIPAIIFRRAQGTSASKSAVQANQNILFIDGLGYGATAYGNSVAALRAQASESFTDTAQGARLTFHTTPVGATTLLERVRIDHDGSVKVVADNQELQIGASQDLRLYHDGTDSTIENDTGNLILKVGGELSLSEVSTTTTAPSAGGAGALPATPDGYVTIIVNGTAKKFPFYPA